MSSSRLDQLSNTGSIRTAIKAPSERSAASMVDDASSRSSRIGTNSSDRRPSVNTSHLTSNPRAGGDGDGIQIPTTPRASSLKSTENSQSSRPSQTGQREIRFNRVPPPSAGSGSRRSSQYSPRSTDSGGRRPTNYGLYPPHSRRRRRSARSAAHAPPPSQLYHSTVSAAHAAIRWRWRAQPRRYLTTGSDPDPDLPASMGPELPAHSRWLWNSKRSDLHWRSTPHNPVDNFYETSLGERAIKRQLGLFGRRYTRYPNPATLAVPEAGRHMFARAVSKAVDRDSKAQAAQIVDIEDVKAVAEQAVGQFFPTTYGRRRFSQIPSVNRFLLSLIEYFHHYFQDRKTSELAKQNNCLVFDKAGLAERQLRMHDCKLEASRCYAKFVLGRGMPFHHTNEGAFGTISASSADRQFWEAFYAFTTQVVWITFGRPNCTVIVRELGRIFRTLYLDPARREGSARAYKNRDLRRNAAFAPLPSKGSKKTERDARHDVKPTNAAELASHNFLAMCVAMARVFGVYECPPMPPKPIYGLLNNRSAFVNNLLAEDPNRRPCDKHVADRGAIGILGHPRNEFDDNLDPIDVEREKKYRQLKFLGPISERAQVTRITSVTPYLLLPTLPSASDLEKFT